jgi:hypothetical protein
MGVEGDPELAKVRATLHSPGCLSGELHRRQQKHQENANNGDGDEELEEG